MGYVREEDFKRRDPAVDAAATRDDSTWFKQRPARTWRLRPYRRGEAINLDGTMRDPFVVAVVKVRKFIIDAAKSAGVPFAFVGTAGQGAVRTALETIERGIAAANALGA